MATRSFALPSSVLVSFGVLALALAGCASGRAAVTTTSSAEAPTGVMAGEDDAVATTEAAEAKDAPAREASDLGELICRTKDDFGVVSELYIAWSGKEGKGVLRQLAPSGMRSETRVRAEREGDLLFADDVKSETDLLVHAATVGRRDGKKYIRLGDMKQSWNVCE